jgi:hypothetical protein
MAGTAQPFRTIVVAALDTALISFPVIVCRGSGQHGHRGPGQPGVGRILAEHAGLDGAVRPIVGMEDLLGLSSPTEQFTARKPKVATSVTAGE